MKVHPFLIAAILVGSTLSANPEIEGFRVECKAPCPSPQMRVTCPPVETNSCCGQWSLVGDLLYWKPMVNAIRWAQEQNRASPINNNFLMRPDLDWGFRVGAGFDCNGSYGEVSYLWYESWDVIGIRRTEFVLPILIFGVGNAADNFQKASYRLLFQYQNVDLRWGQHLMQGCRCNLDLFGNLRWVDMQRKSRVRGVNEQGQVGEWAQHSRFTGAALGVGASADITIWRCLSFAGTLNGMAAIGERKVTLNERVDRGVGTIERQPGESSVIPVLDMRMGVRYLRGMCGCVNLTAEAGYEFNHYWSVLDYTQQGTADIGITPCQNVGFAGPYFSLKASY